jgi:hypothetical protein
MNEDLLRTLMSDVDPVRDLSDETLDELVPYDRLMARVIAGIEQPIATTARARDSIWRRASVRVSAAAAAAVLVASGAVALWDSSPSVVPSGLALGTVHSAWVLDSGSAPVKGTTTTGYESFNPNAFPWLVANGRVQSTLRLDGLTIAPSSLSIRPSVSARVVANELWATTALKGDAQLVFGYGDVTTNIAGVTKLHDAPVWIAIATARPCTSQTACDASHLTSLPLTVVVSGYGFPNSAAKTGTPIAFVYQSAGNGSATKPKLLPAILQASVAWIQNGPVENRILHILTGPFPCGALHGYNFLPGAGGATLTIESWTPESTLGDYCTSSLVVHKNIQLTGSSNGVTKLLANPMAKFIHAPTGPIEATR